MSRQFPEDLRRQRYRHGAVVTLCEDGEEAEEVTQMLADAGFLREEMVLVSHDVSSLQTCWPGEDRLQVGRPASVNEPASRMIGLVNGLAFGALGGLAVAYLSGRSPWGHWPPVVLGALLGGLLGVVLARALYHRLRGSAETVYDQALSGGQVLVGIGLTSEGDEQRRERVRAVIEGSGRRVFDLMESER